MDVMNLVKTFRKKRGYTQEQIAKTLGIDRTSYNNLERGKTNLRADDFIKLINYLDIPITALSKEELIVISKRDLESIEKHSRALYDITSKVKDQNSNSLGTTKNTNIQIGNNNSIHDSFNGK